MQRGVVPRQPDDRRGPRRPRLRPKRPWFPPRLSGSGAVTCLEVDERRKLTHVGPGAYAHALSLVEELIAPKLTELASGPAVEIRAAFDALTSFASEEVEHMNLFRAVREMVDATVGSHRLHFVSASEADCTFDPLARSNFEHHWQEETQHARIDHLEVLRAFASVVRLPESRVFRITGAPRCATSTGTRSSSCRCSPC